MKPSPKAISSSPDASQPGVFRRAASYLGPHRSRFILALTAMIIYGATDGVIPLLLRRVLDDIFGAQRKDLLFTLVGFIVAFAIFRAVFDFCQSYLSSTVGLRVVEDMRNDISRKLLRHDASYFSAHQTGGLISRMTNDTLLVRSAITDGTIGVLRESVRILALLGAALWLDPWLALISFLVFPIGVLPVLRFGKRVRKLSKTGQEQFGGLTSILHEIILGHKVVQSFVMEKYEEERFQRENRNATRSFERSAKYEAISGPTNEILASLGMAGVICYGGLSVIGGVRTQGDFIAFITALFLLYEPLKKLGKLQSTVQTGMSAAERLFEVIDAKPLIEDTPNALRLTANQAEIEYRNVWFQYPSANAPAMDNPGGPSGHPAEEWALQNINFTLPAGKTVALVGMSGGGKSTIANLLPRFYDATQGYILLNGRELREYTLESLRTAISVVSQHTFLFNDTVFQNIAYGRLGATADEVVEAARAAYAHEFIERLPQGYDTMIGEQGLRLSGGERSRIALARAILKNAPLLVLDEATASLDSESEQLVQLALDRLMKGRTVLVIAHRLATIRAADNILVISNGKLIEQGTHEELIARGGEYSKLYEIQFGTRGEQEPRAALG